MKEKLAKLIDVKSIITIIMTFVFSLMSLTGRLSENHFHTIFTTVIAFYYGTQHAKNSTEVIK